MGDAQRGAVACRAVERAEINTQWQENHTKTHINPSVILSWLLQSLSNYMYSANLWLYFWVTASESSFPNFGPVDRQLCHIALEHISAAGNCSTFQNSIQFQMLA